MEDFLNNQEKETYTGIHEVNSKKIFIILIMLIFAVLLVPKYSRTLKKMETYTGPKKIQIDKLGNIYINMKKRIYKFDNEGHKFLVIGKLGTSSGSFEKYIDFSVDKNENIYVADSKYQKIYVFNREGDPILSFGETGTSKGKFKSIIKISVDKNGDIYVLDIVNSRVQAFSNEGKFRWLYKIETRILGILGVPDEIVIDKKGRILVIDTDVKILYIISNTSNLLKKVPLSGCKFSGPGGIVATDAFNNYVIADAYTPYIWKIDSTGNVEKLNLDFLKKEKIAISDLTADESGNLWVVDEEKFAVLKINPEGTVHSLKQNDIGVLLKDLESQRKRIMQLQRIYLFLIITFVLMSLVLLFYKGK